MTPDSPLPRRRPCNLHDCAAILDCIFSDALQCETTAATIRDLAQQTRQAIRLQLAAAGHPPLDGDHAAQHAAALALDQAETLDDLPDRHEHLHADLKQAALNALTAYAPGAARLLHTRAAACGVAPFDFLIALVQNGLASTFKHAAERKDPTP